MTAGPRRALGRDVAVYGLSTVLVQVVAVATTPVYTRLLGPAAFGVVELLTVVVSFIITALFEGMGVAAVRLYFGEPEEQRKALLSTGLLSSVGVTVLAAAVAVAAADPLAKLLLGTSAEAVAVAAAAIYLPIGVAARFSAEVLRMQRRPWPYLASAVLAAVVGSTVTIVLLAATDAGPEAVYYGMAAGAAGALLLNLVMAGRALGLRFSVPHLRRLAAFGGPLVFSGLAGWSLVLVDRIILVQFVNLSDVGYYALANRIAGVLLIGTYAFASAWTPYVLDLFTDDPDDEPGVRADVLRHSLAAMAVLAVGASVVSREGVEILAGRPFLPAADVVPTLSLGFLFFSTLNVLQVPFLIDHRTGAMARLSGLAAVANVVACLVLIPLWGTQGAAIATVVGFGFQAGAYYVSGQGLRPAPYDRGRVFGILLLALPFMAAGWLAIEPLALDLAVKGALGLVFVGLLVVLRLVDVHRLTDEVRMMRSR